MWRWMFSAALLLASLWFGNLALFNWWATGGPPNPSPGTYVFRGNVFFCVSCLLFVGFVIRIVSNLRQGRRCR